MLASELIQKINELVKEHGDFNVYYNDDCYLCEITIINKIDKKVWTNLENYNGFIIE